MYSCIYVNNYEEKGKRKKRENEEIGNGQRKSTVERPDRTGPETPQVQTEAQGISNPAVTNAPRGTQRGQKEVTEVRLDSTQPHSTPDH